MSETDQLPRQLRLLKGLVIGLGILLGVAAIVVVFAAIWKFSEQQKPVAATTPNTPATSASATDSLPAFGTAQLALPVGCEVESATASGDRLVLLVGGPDECRRVVIADLKSGKKLGEFQFPTAGQ
ncbi:DUF6476 family protein [Dongia soli]|uniref:DUF6476 family protein n=1 Tax=Dongia soli TaxID=600628 RepID=A0ABU5ECS5_9PROT|nr:DUF6476 family protein [Dongia soli]MDY0883355.1 DUF6476 family protein [Dongia soli]